MPTTFTLNGAVLDAMLSFTAEPNSIHSVLTGVLAEITPDSLRLVATQTHVLGVMHLTAMNGYGLDLQCAEPLQIVLPVAEMKPLLKDRRYPAVTVSIDGLQVTVRNSAGITTTIQGRPGDEFPTYLRVLPEGDPQPLPGLALDLGLLARFTAFARTLREEPKLTMSFHSVQGPIGVRLKTLSSFYGVIMPLQLECSAAVPNWLRPPVEERTIRALIEG